MACSTPQAIAMAARVTPTVAHVLRLISSSYVECAAGVVAGAGAGPSRPRLPFRGRVATTPMVHSRRFASSATESPSPGPAPLPEPTRRKRKQRVARFQHPWMVISDSTHDLLFAGESESDSAGQGSSKLTAAEFRARWDAAPESRDSRPILLDQRLEVVASVFCASTTTRDDWEWLLALLERLKDADFAQMMYASGSLMRGLRGVALAALGEWEHACANMAMGIKLIFPGLGAHHILLLQQYVDIVRRAGRIEDVATVVRYGGKALHWELCDTSETERRGKHLDAVRSILRTALNELPAPIDWLEEQATRAAFKNNHSGTLLIQQLGVVFFTSLLSDRSRATDAFVFWCALQKRFPASAERHPVNVCVLADNLAGDGQHVAARQALAAVRDKLDKVRHSALSGMLSSFAQQGMQAEALEVWAVIAARFVPTAKDWYARAYAHATAGDHDGALKILEERLGDKVMIDQRALLVLQAACIATADADGALKYLEHALAIAPELAPLQNQLFLYSRQANVDGAVEVFQRMVSLGLEPSAKAYASLVSAFANKADYVNAGYVFSAMVKAGHTPDEHAWSALLNASIEAGEWILLSKQIAEIPQRLLREPGLATTILKAYVLVRAPSSTIMTFFRRLEDPNARAWALAIQAAADDDNQVLARSLFDEMDSRSKLDPLCPAPTVYVFSILLAMYLRAGDRASSRAVYDTMIYRDILPTSVTYGIITTSYANSAGESSAEQAHNFAMTVYDITIASEMPHSRGNASENVFGPLLIAAGRAQDMDRVKQYYDLIRSTGCTSFTLTTKLMDAYRRNGQIKPMYRLWLRLFRKALHTVPRLSPGMAPDPMHKTTRSQNNLLCVPLSITMRAFAAAGLHGRIHELWRTVRTSGFGFDASNYNHLAQSLLRTGDIETAFFIVDRVLIPRYDEVRERVNRAQRMTLCLPPVEASPPDAEQEAIGDWDTPELDDALASVPMNLTSEDVAERGPRVSNRRKGFLASPRGTRWAHEEETSGSGSGSGSDSNGPAEPDLDILRYWRPSDILWRPSRATARLLEQVYTSLEDQRAYQAWLGVSIGDDDADLEHEHEHNAEDAIPALTILDPAAARNVNNIQHIAVKHRDGSPVHSTPKALLIRLNRRYARAVALIEFYRLKRKRRAYT